jgi:hypothetical protein
VDWKASFCQYSLRIQLEKKNLISTTERPEEHMERSENSQMDVRVAVADGSDVALEMADIDGIKSDLCTHRISISCIGATGGQVLTMVTKSLISASVKRSPMR